MPIRRQERALKRLQASEDNKAWRLGLAFIGSIVSARKALERSRRRARCTNDEAAVQRGYANAGAAGARTPEIRPAARAGQLRRAALNRGHARPFERS